MNKFIIKSILYCLILSAIFYFVRVYFKTNNYLSDVGSLSLFISIFGILYGIMLAFIVIEAWNQFNNTSSLIEKEAKGLERLFQLILYFRDNNLTKEIKGAISDYTNFIIKDKFSSLGKGKRSSESSKLFRKIFFIIRDVKFDDEHDQIVFGHIINDYNALSQIRSDRIKVSLDRLPSLLKFFIYSSTIFILLTMIVAPFENIYYGFLTVFILTFVISMVIQIIEDLDNPFVGAWVISTEPFERALKNIEESY